MRLLICERCKIVVPADRDSCPNIGGDLSANHRLVIYAPEARESIENRIALSAVDAAAASLEIVKAALR